MKDTKFKIGDIIFRKFIRTDFVPLGINKIMIVAEVIDVTFDYELKIRILYSNCERGYKKGDVTKVFIKSEKDIVDVLELKRIKKSEIENKIILEEL